MKNATIEAERGGFVYVTALDNSGKNERFLWRRGQSCVLFRTTDRVVVAVNERPNAECDAPPVGVGGGSGHGEGSSGRNEATDLCKKAVTRRGYDRFDDIDADKQHGGGWEISGRARGDRGRAAFSCSIDGRSIRKLVVNPLGGGNSGHNVVTCESENRGYRRCEIDTRRGVHLVERISETRCVEGQNWGVRSGAVWVDNGCSARFEAGGGR
ncbi:MAG: DUF3011 domain-containing protein [Burkholderiales bacterium]|nr:DUF3011 domain-containing protein [Burkholderiales bacterium]